MCVALVQLGASSSARPLPRVTGPTHRAGAGVGHAVLVGGPVVARPLPLGEGPVEGRPDVVHLVDAHGVALEDGAAGDMGGGGAVVKT